MSDLEKVLWQDRKRTFLGLPWSFTKYKLTPERFFLEQGVFTKKEDEVRLYRIMDMSMTQTFGQRMLGVGTIHCCSSDSSMKDFDIINIKKPRQVKEMLSEAVERERESKRVTNREYMHHHMDEDFIDDDY